MQLPPPSAPTFVFGGSSIAGGQFQLHRWPVPSLLTLVPAHAALGRKHLMRRLRQQRPSANDVSNNSDGLSKQRVTTVVAAAALPSSSEALVGTEACQPVDEVVRASVCRRISPLATSWNHSSSPPMAPTTAASERLRERRERLFAGKGEWMWCVGEEIR